LGQARNRRGVRPTRENPEEGGSLERDDLYEQVLVVIAGLRGREDDLNFQILLMRHVEGHSTEEVGALLDLLREAGANRLRRAVEKVRRVLGCRPCEGT
jgi:DNA-directed RNA polymerase specialized sigma24 family protein